jgi:UrcA family protein
MKKIFSPTRVALLIAGAAAIGLASPGLAQSSDEELVVTGRYGGTVPDSVKSLSQTVSYRDLDLSTAGGRAEFRHRIRLTARFLCGKLGEDNSSVGVGPSCRTAATDDAMKRAGTLEAHFAPRGTTWVSGPAWSAPYPATWTSQYPD